MNAPSTAQTGGRTIMIQTENRNNRLESLPNTMSQKTVDLLIERTTRAIDLCLANMSNKRNRTRVIQLRGQLNRLEACREEWERIVETKPDQKSSQNRVMEQIVAPGEQHIMVVENINITPAWNNMIKNSATTSDYVLENPLNMKIILGMRMNKYEMEIYTNIKTKKGDNRFIVNDFTSRIISELTGNNGEIDELKITKLINDNITIYKKYYNDIKPMIIEIMSCLVERGAYYVKQVYNMIIRLLEIELEAERDYLPSDKIIDIAEGSWFRDYIIAYQLFRRINGEIEEHAVKMLHCYYSLILETSSNKKIKHALKNVERRQRYDFELPLIAPRCRNCFHAFYNGEEELNYCSYMCADKDQRRDCAIRNRRTE